MKMSRYSPEQIAIALRLVENGTPVANVRRKIGIAERPLYQWNRRCVCIGASGP